MVVLPRTRHIIRIVRINIIGPRRDIFIKTPGHGTYQSKNHEPTFQKLYLSHYTIITNSLTFPYDIIKDPRPDMMLDAVCKELTARGMNL